MKLSDNNTIEISSPAGPTGERKENQSTEAGTGTPESLIPFTQEGNPRIVSK
jgi:hypothetical protein